MTVLIRVLQCAFDSYEHKSFFKVQQRRGQVLRCINRSDACKTERKKKKKSFAHKPESM